MGGNSTSGGNSILGGNSMPSYGGNSTPGGNSMPSCGCNLIDCKGGSMSGSGPDWERLSRAERNKDNNTTDVNVSRIFDEVNSDVIRKEKAGKDKKLREQLLKNEMKKAEAKKQKRRQTLERLFKVVKRNFSEIVKNQKIKKFLDDKFEKQEKEKEQGFVPYFQYKVGNPYFPAYIVITREYELKMADQWWQDWLSNDEEFNNAVKAFTNLGGSKRLLIEFLLKDWNKKAEYIGRTYYPAEYP